MKNTAVLVCLALLSIVSANAPETRTQGNNEHNGNYRAHSNYEHNGNQFSTIGSSDLRSIAQGSADQANSAVAQQHTAARQASYIAKSTLAQAAIHASAAAQTAFAGKRVLLENIERQLVEAQSDVNIESQQLELAKQARKNAFAALHEAEDHVNILTTVANSAQQVLQNAQLVAQSIETVLASQSEHVSNEKSRYQSLLSQLEAVRSDFAATKEAADNASSAAQAAQESVAAAAAHASQELESLAFNSNHNEMDDDPYVKSNGNTEESGHRQLERKIDFIGRLN